MDKIVYHVKNGVLKQYVLLSETDKTFSVVYGQSVPNFRFLKSTVDGCEYYYKSLRTSIATLDKAAAIAHLKQQHADFKVMNDELVANYAKRLDDGLALIAPE